MPRKVSKPKPKKEVAGLRRRLSSIEAQLAKITAQTRPTSIEPKRSDESQSLPALPQNITMPSRRTKSAEPPVFELQEITQLNTRRHDVFSLHDAFRGRLFDELRFAWLCGRWSSFEQLDLRTVEQQEDRELIAALAAAAYVHLGRRVEARQAIQTAIAWGLDPVRAASIIMADLHRTMAWAHYFNRNRAASEIHLQSSGLSHCVNLETNLKSIKKFAVSERAPKGQRGLKISDDLREALPDFEAKIVFDVGANKGQSVRTMLQDYPSAKIYSFEPATAAYEALKRNYGTFPQVAIFKKALGAEKRRASLAHGSNSTMSRIVGHNNNLAPDTASSVELVEVDTIDAFCAEHGIEHIDFLKVDTEGHELDVLQGALKMLDQQAVDLIALEAGMTRLNRRHCALEDLKQILEDRGYYLFGLYEQKHEWISKQPQLRRSNAVFISSRVVEQSSGRPAVSLLDREKR